MTPATADVRLGKVSKTFGETRVLDAVDLDVAAGSLLVLLGASGAGKSTLLRIVAGLLDADAGTVEIDGKTVASPKSVVPAERRGVGMVFQTLELWPHMSVAENVAFGLPGRPRRGRAIEHPRVLEVADAVGLPRDLLARSPATLSGGERQRVAIARALAPAPRVLLYDEPLANLDPERRAEIRRLVREIRAAGKTTVIYVTHDAAEALEMGDQLAVLDRGRVVDRGAPADVYRAPRCAASARALGAASLLPLRVATRPGTGAVFETPLGSFPVAAGAPAPSGATLACFRPEQIAPGSEGTKAVVTDAYPRGADWAFSARLAEGGHVVFGRSRTRLSPGAGVLLATTGSPSPLVEPAVGAPLGAPA